MRAHVRLGMATITILASVSTHSALGGLPVGAGRLPAQVEVTVTGNNFTFNPALVEVGRTMPSGSRSSPRTGPTVWPSTRIACRSAHRQDIPPSSNFALTSRDASSSTAT